MKIRVGAFFGGRSVEHEVSIISALQTIHAIDSSVYDVVPIYITKQGLMYTGDVLKDIDNYKDLNQLLTKCERIIIANDSDEVVLLKHSPGLFGKKILDKIDVAFPVFHGTNGEDGTFQGFLETLNIPYVGCDVQSSALGMDKIMMKKVLHESGIPVVNYYAFYSKFWLKDSQQILEQIEGKLKYPLIIKPANLGSSIGIKKAKNKAELEAAINFARSFSQQVLVEEVVANLREINCAVVGDYEHTEASVCEEPVGADEILSYQDKYLNNSTKGMSGSKRRIPAQIPEQMTLQIQQLAKDTFMTLGCNGVSRIDFLVDDSTNMVYVNEINTIPGSLAFYLWEATGKPFTKLTTELIQLSLKRSRERNELTYSYESNLLSQKGIFGIKK